MKIKMFLSFVFLVSIVMNVSIFAHELSQEKIYNDDNVIISDVANERARAECSGGNGIHMMKSQGFANLYDDGTLVFRNGAFWACSNYGCKENIATEYDPLIHDKIGYYSFVNIGEEVNSSFTVIDSSTVRYTENSSIDGVDFYKVY